MEEEVSKNPYGLDTNMIKFLAVELSILAVGQDQTLNQIVK
jgi:hypothetical protein